MQGINVSGCYMVRTENDKISQHMAEIIAFSVFAIM